MRRLPHILLFAAAAIGATPVLAQRAMELQDAVERVQRESGGRILSAETVRIGRQKLYRVKVLTPDGRVQVEMVPAAGEPVGRRQDAR